MIPRPGTKIEKAIAFIKANPGARSAAIAAHINSSSGSIGGLLAPYVSSGDLLCCKVEVPGMPQPQHEYRVGSGIPSLALAPELKPKRNARLAWLPSGMKIPSLTSTPGSDAGAPPVKDSLANIEFPDLPDQFSINEHGELRYQLDGKQHHLTPAQTAALGTFLMKTEGLWRPA